MQQVHFISQQIILVLHKIRMFYKHKLFQVTEAKKADQ